MARAGCVSPEVRETLRCLRGMGAYLHEIAGLFDLSETAVRYYVRSVPCPWGDWRRLSSANRESALRAVEMAEQGLGRDAIAERLGLATRQGVNQAIRRGRQHREVLENHRTCRRAVQRELRRLADERADGASATVRPSPMRIAA